MTLVGTVQKAQAVYGRQQFYAERAVKLNTPKTVQIGHADRVTLSSESISQATTAGAAPVATMAPKAIAYEDPRRAVRAMNRETKETDRSEKKNQESKDSLVDGVATAK